MRWNDPDLALSSPADASSAFLSDKDRNLPRLRDLPDYFTYGGGEPGPADSNVLFGGRVIGRHGSGACKMASAAITLSKALRIALTAYNNGKFSEAERLCHAIIAAKPDLLDALLLLAGVQVALGRPRDALASCDQALAARPGNAAALHNRGIILHELSRFEDALASYDQALAVRPDEAATHNNRGNSLRELRRFDEALASYEKAIGLKADYTDAFYNRGALLEKLKRLDEALASYDKAIALKPDHADALFRRGAVFQEFNRLDEALTSREKAIALKPELGPIYRRLISSDPADVSETHSGMVRTTKGEQGLQVYWCLGMHASASTWTYNVARQIATSVYPNLPVQEHFVKTLADVARLGPPGRTHIIKTHDMEDDDAAAALSVRADAIIITIRDPRDAVTSLMLYHRFSRDLAKPSEAQKAFGRSLSLVEKSARLCARFAGEQRSLLLRYEAGFTDDVTTLDRIAGSFRRPLATSDRMRIFESSRRVAVEAFIAEMPQRRSTLIDMSSGDLMDPVTQWHTHHAGRSGEIGRWRHMLTQAQVLEIERRLGDWMDRFSYQRHEAQPDD